MSEIAKGYKKTDIGVIPEDWEVRELGEVLSILGGGTFKSKDSSRIGIKWLKIANVGLNKILWEDESFLPYEFNNIYENFLLKESDCVLALTRPILNRKLKIAYLEKGDAPALLNQRVGKIVMKNHNFLKYFYYVFQKYEIIGAFLQSMAGTDPPNLGNKGIYLTKAAIPNPEEQTAIAEALSDTDSLISSLEKLIDKKKKIKEGAMQELLTGKKRLEGFSGEWEVKRLGEIADVLDNFRKPLNENERQKMKGNIPYCGANGVVGYVDDYIIDDEIILIAEDGGYFDEYKTRPIAYKMTGKCWVNNHAHILKSKIKIDQNFIFYSIVNKNILDFITGGTRAKLNKSQLIKIEIFLPKEKEEQTAIAEILSDMDSEISSLETKLEKYKQIKQGMMQELLTGRIRLV